MLLGTCYRGINKDGLANSGVARAQNHVALAAPINRAMQLVEVENILDVVRRVSVALAPNDVVAVVSSVIRLWT